MSNEYRNRIFLSYAREDQERVLEIYEKLKAEGFSPWMDVRDIISGQNWENESERVLKGCSFMVIFFSQISVFKKGNFQKELKLALEIDKEVPEDQIFIIPVCLNDCKIPKAFTKYHYIDFRDAKGFDSIVESIVAGKRQAQEEEQSFYHNGTVADSETGLVWMIPFVGQQWKYNNVIGDASSFSWYDASSKFGRAQNIPASALECLWSNQTPANQLIRIETYLGYKPGKEAYSFAGYEDWRLPTAQELWSFAQSDFQHEMNSRFNIQPTQVWAANPSTSSFMGFFSAMNMGGPCAWMFGLDETSTEGFGDMNRALNHAIRLVRLGTAFQAIH